MGETPTWDREMLNKGIVAAWHYANGLKHAMGKPLAESNKKRLGDEADAIAHLIAFAEWNIEEIGI